MPTYFSFIKETFAQQWDVHRQITVEFLQEEVKV